MTSEQEKMLKNHGVFGYVYRQALSNGGYALLTRLEYFSWLTTKQAMNLGELLISICEGEVTEEVISELNGLLVQHDFQVCEADVLGFLGDVLEQPVDWLQERLTESLDDNIQTLVLKMGHEWAASEISKHRVLPVGTTLPRRIGQGIGQPLLTLEQDYRLVEYVVNVSESPDGKSFAANVDAVYISDDGFDVESTVEKTGYWPSKYEYPYGEPTAACGGAFLCGEYSGTRNLNLTETRVPFNGDTVIHWVDRDFLWVAVDGNATFHKTVAKGGVWHEAKPWCQMSCKGYVEDYFCISRTLGLSGGTLYYQVLKIPYVQRLYYGGGDGQYPPPLYGTGGGGMAVPPALAAAGLALGQAVGITPGLTAGAWIAFDDRLTLNGEPLTLDGEEIRS